MLAGSVIKKGNSRL